jgi:hypothetical protein
VFSLLSLLLNIVLKFLGRIIWQEKDIKGIEIGKEEVKLPLLADDLILHLKTPSQNSDMINMTSKTSGYKINIQTH